MWNKISILKKDAEIINNKYSVNSIFEIASDGPVSENPRVKAICQNQKIVFAIESSLFLIGNERNITDYKYIGFDSPIDCIAVSFDGSLVICATSDGNIYGISIGGINVFHITAQINDVRDYGRTFVALENVNHDYYLQCVNGNLYRLSGIDVQLSETILLCENDKTLSLNETVLNNVVLEKVAATPISFTTDSSSLVNICDRLSSIFGGENTIKIANSTQNNDIHLPDEYEGIQLILDLNQAIIVLCKNGALFDLCPYTNQLKAYKTPKGDHIQDIIAIEKDQSQIELMLLIKSRSTQQTFIRIVGFPNWKCRYEIPVPATTWIINQPKLSANMYYLCADLSETSAIRSVQMRAISETQPENHLQTLIERNLLDEAEKFAIEFKLSLQPIYKAKARRFVTQLNNSDTDDADNWKQQFREFFEVAKMIKNEDFLLKLRLMDIKDRNVMRQLLEFLLERISAEKYRFDYDEIQEQLLRLDTLRLIDPFECNANWRKFFHGTQLINCCFTYFKSDMSIACLILSKHASSIIPFLNENMIEKVLIEISGNIEPFNVIQWLRHYVPLVTTACPKSAPLIIDFVMSKIASFQCSREWPQIGLEFCKNMLDIFGNVVYLSPDAQRHRDTSMDRLRNINNVLEDLTILKTKFNLTLTLNDYMQNSTEAMAFEILRRMNMNHLHSGITNFLQAIFNEKGMDLIPTIAQYINFLIRGRNSINMWQERAIICILAIHNEQMKLQCAINVLKAAPVPWSAVLDSLVKLNTSTHPLANEIMIAHQMQKIKIMRNKYGWPENAADSDVKFVYRMVKCNGPDLFQDLHEFTEYNVSIKDHAYLYAISSLTSSGCVAKAIKLYDELDDQYTQKISNVLLRTTTGLIEEATDDKEEFNNLMELIKHIISREHSPISKKVFADLMKVDLLRDTFGLSASLQSLKQPELVDRHLKEGIANLIRKLKQSPDNLVHNAMKYIRLLASALNVEGAQVTLQFCRQMKNVQLTCALTKMVLHLYTVNMQNANDFIDLAVLLLAQQTLMIDDVKCDTTVPMTYPLAHQLLLSVQNISIVFYEEIRDLLKWARIGTHSYDMDSIEDFMKSNDELDADIIKTIVENIGNDDSNVARARRDSLSVFEQVKENNRSPRAESKPDRVVKCLSLGLVNILNDLELDCSFATRFKIYKIPRASTARSELTNCLDQLIKTKQHVIAFLIIQFIRQIQSKSNTMIFSNDSFSAIIKKILKSALTSKEVNFDRLLPFLLAVSSPDDCLQYLGRDLKSGLAKENCLMLIEKYKELTHKSTKFALDRRPRLTYHYYLELCQIDPQLKNDPNFSFTTHNSLFDILTNKIVDVRLLGRISKDFNWNYQKVLVAQIEAIISTQDLEFDIVKDVFGKEQIVVKMIPEKVVDLCRPYLQQLTDTTVLEQQLRTFIDTINPYFYEMHLTVIYILSEIAALSPRLEKWEKILLFLKHKMVTRRNKRVGQVESDWWLSEQPDGGILPRIAEFRFPFKNVLSDNISALLDHEVNINDCEQWFPLIKLKMSLDKASAADIQTTQDKLCMTALKSSVSSYKLSNSENDESNTWHLQPINNAFLQSVLNLIRHMHDEHRILFMLYFVANNAPPGADQVEATYECYKFAQENIEELQKQTRTLDLIQKINRKYPMHKIQHLLHLYGLNDERFLQLIENPRELITALYMHESVTNPVNKIDINQIAEDIANLHGINLCDIQKLLLRKWLLYDSDEIVDGLEQTFLDDANASALDTNDEVEMCEDSVARACYILKCWEASKSTAFLLTHVNSMCETEGLNTGRKLQVMECVIRIVDSGTDSLFLDMVNTSEYIALKCVHSLKKFGFNFNTEKFKTYDKLKVLKQIWQTNSNNPKALDIISYICISYQIFEPIIWNNLLKQMVNCQMLNELKPIVKIVSTNASLVHLAGLVTAWEYIIRMPLKNISHERSHAQDVELCNVLFELQSSPVKSKMNILDLAETCVRFGQIHIGAIFIAFCNDDQKGNLCKLINSRKTDSLKADIIELEEMGIYPIITKLVCRELNL